MYFVTFKQRKLVYTPTNRKRSLYPNNWSHLVFFVWVVSFRMESLIECNNTRTAYIHIHTHIHMYSRFKTLLNPKFCEVYVFWKSVFLEYIYSVHMKLSKKHYDYNLTIVHNFKFLGRYSKQFRKFLIPLKCNI